MTSEIFNRMVGSYTGIRLNGGGRLPFETVRLSTLELRYRVAPGKLEEYFCVPPKGAFLFSEGRRKNFYGNCTKQIFWTKFFRLSIDCRRAKSSSLIFGASTHPLNLIAFGLAGWEQCPLKAKIQRRYGPWVAIKIVCCPPMQDACQPSPPFT